MEAKSGRFGKRNALIGDVAMGGAERTRRWRQAHPRYVQHLEYPESVGAFLKREAGRRGISVGALLLVSAVAFEGVEDAEARALIEVVARTHKIRFNLENLDGSKTRVDIGPYRK